MPCDENWTITFFWLLNSCLFFLFEIEHQVIGLYGCFPCFLTWPKIRSHRRLSGYLARSSPRVVVLSSCEKSRVGHLGNNREEDDESVLEMLLKFIPWTLIISFSEVMHLNQKLKEVTLYKSLKFWWRFCGSRKLSGWHRNLLNQTLKGNLTLLTRKAFTK